MTVPEAVATVLGTPVRVGEPAQAFPFLTVDDDGAPHCAVVSSTEVRLGGGGDGGDGHDADDLYVALGGRRSRSYLEARPRATLLVVEGTTLHTCKLVLTAGLDHGGVFAAAFRLVDHSADSLGIDLVPLGFTPPPDIASLERWDVTAAALEAIHRTRSPS
jgi:hypothetical protein